MTVPMISSPSNPRLRSLVALRRRRARETSGQTVVEGYEELRLAVDAGVLPRCVFVCDELFSPAGRAGSQNIGDQFELLEWLHDHRVEVVRLARPAYEKVAYREGPDGLLAVVDSPRGVLEDLHLTGSSHLSLLCQGVEKPGNLGAMMRTADAAGVDAVVAVDPVTDWGNPNVVRASKGTLFAVSVATATTAEAIAWAEANGICLVVTTPETDEVYTDVDLTGRVALVVGSEKHGVDRALWQAASHRVRIPMLGRVNSLNVAASAAVVLYEAVRQRSGAHFGPVGGGSPSARW